jgi:hypothetical protein
MKKLILMALVMITSLTMSSKVNGDGFLSNQKGSIFDRKVNLNLPTQGGLGRYSEDRKTYKAVCYVAAVSFITMGCLTQVNQVWVQDPNGYIGNNGTRGGWQKQTWIQDPNKWAPIASGLFIFGISFCF